MRSIIDNWVLDGERIEKATGDRALANDIGDAVRAGRTETWVVTTRPNGSTIIEVLDASGKTKDIDTSNILSSVKNISGAKP